MYATKVVIALLTLGAVGFAAPVEKREAATGAIVPPPAMLGPLGLKSTSIVSSSTVEVTSTATATVVASSTAEATSTVVVSSTHSASSSVVVSSVPVPTTTLVTVAGTKLATPSVSSSSTQATTTPAVVKVTISKVLKPVKATTAAV